MSYTDEELINARKKYDEAINKIEFLEQCDLIKEYHKCLEDAELLRQEKEHLEREAGIKKYRGCSHIRVCTMIHTDKNYKVQRGYGCIKCGVDSSVIYKPITELTPEEMTMLSYLNSCARHLNGLNLNMNCDIELATAVYKKIKEANPNASEEDLIKYFRRAIHFMRDESMSREREDSRVYRLGLRPHFSCWYKESVISKD